VNRHGKLVRDPITGRITTVLRLSVEELYPVGRKHCSRCGRWRLLVDFAPKGDYVQSWCRTCQRIHARNGKLQPRVPAAPHDSKLARKRELWARNIEAIRADPEKHREYLEDQRIRQYDRRRAQGVPERQRRTPIERDFRDTTRFMRWLRHTDVKLTDTEARIVRRVRAGEQDRLELGVIDRIMTRGGATHLVDAYYPPK
jgi:hypothetical protein